MLIELHDHEGRKVAIRADSVAHIDNLSDGGCNVYLDYREPPVCLRVKEGLSKVVRMVNDALYDYEEEE